MTRLHAAMYTFKTLSEQHFIWIIQYGFNTSLKEIYSIEGANQLKFYLLSEMIIGNAYSLSPDPKRRSLAEARKMSNWEK